MSQETTTFDPDRAQGVLVGLAAGDKNLGPIEMALIVAESLIDEQRFDLDDITNRWLGWWQRGAWDTGRVFDSAMQMIDQGVSPESAAKHTHQELNGMTAGCNGAHRAPVLAAFAGLLDEDLDNAARELTVRTHQHVLAQDAAVAVARLCRELINGSPFDDAMKTLDDGLDAEIQQSVSASRQAPGGRGGYSPETLQSALYFVATRESFEAALEDALDYAGPPNYCPVLVGAIGGARWGAAAVEERYLSHCRDKERVLSMAKKLVREEDWQ